MKVFVSIPQKNDVMKTFMPEAVQKYLEERFEVCYSPLDRQLQKEEIARYAGDAEAIVTGWGHVPFDAKTLENTSISLIVHTGGSVGNLVPQEVYDMGIRVLSGNNLYADSVAEGVIAYMLTALRKIPDYLQSVRDGNWIPVPHCTEGLLDQSVGIIGLGAISIRLLELLAPFRVNVKIYSQYPVPEELLRKYQAVQVPLEEIFATCKIVSLHSAMSERTRGMIGKEHFNLLQEGALFVNTARGKIIRENEMIEALKTKRFWAILDVYHQEPLAWDSELRRLENVYPLPHVGGPTVDRRPLITKCLIDNMVKYEAGEMMELEIDENYARRMTVES